VEVNTTQVSSGLREFRILTAVRRPDNAEIRATSGWCWQIANGGTNVNSGDCAQKPLSTLARGWYDCFEYKIAETRDWTYPYGGIPSNTDYTLTIGARDGGSSANTDLTSWEVRLDPDFHQGNNGQLLASGTERVNGTPVTIPGSLLTAGEHKLVIIASAFNANCTGGGGINPQRGEVSAVFNVPLKVN
jgi:hypothetical protein